MEKDLQGGHSLQIAGGAIIGPMTNTENNFDICQKGAALVSSVWYNGIKSQNDLGCELQAKEGVLV